MRVLWVSAHREPKSLNGSLRADGIHSLRTDGHEVRESDLYAMNWNPVVSQADFGRDTDERLDVLTASEDALNSGTLSDDIRSEQAKLLWADTVVFQFPLWWFGPPAILKGWFDRLFVQGFAQTVIDPATGRARRYGDGGLVGRRALVITTIGAKAATTGPRGIHGDVNDLLFPLLHGTIWYTGMAALRPFVVNSALKVTDEQYATLATELTQRLAALPDEEPIPYRAQTGGDYDGNLVLRDDCDPVSGCRCIPLRHSGRRG